VSYAAPAATLQLTFAARCFRNNIVAQRFSTAVPQAGTDLGSAGP